MKSSETLLLSLIRALQIANAQMRLFFIASQISETTTVMLETPFFSVIICTYNRAYIIERAINSLIAQHETDWEALIVNDGSTDNTYSIAHTYVQQYANIRYCEHANRGVGYSRTVGIYAAFGRYCTFLDSDDEYLPHHLSSRRTIIEQYPATDIIHGGVEVIGSPFVVDRFDPSKRVHIKDCVLEGTMVIRREIALQLGGFGTLRYAEGADFMERALASGCHIQRATDSSYRYDRTTPDSLCNTRI